MAKKASAVVFAALVLLSACGGTSDGDAGAQLDEANQRIADLEAEAAKTTVAPAESSAPTTTAAPPTTAAAAPTTAAPTTAAPTTAPPTTAAPAPALALMPDVVCMNLQDAQDFIQSETGVFLSLSEDATGQGRNQIIDSNWIVVAQRPDVGVPIDEGDAVLSAVKLDEPNPC